MQLEDFYISTKDLKKTNQLFIESKKNMIPVTDIKFINGKIIIVNNDKTNFDLEKFYSKTQKHNLNTELYLKLEKIKPILGYRIDNHKIIF